MDAPSMSSSCLLEVTVICTGKAVKSSRLLLSIVRSVGRLWYCISILLLPKRLSSMCCSTRATFKFSLLVWTLFVVLKGIEGKDSPTLLQHHFSRFSKFGNPVFDPLLSLYCTTSTINVLRTPYCDFFQPPCLSPDFWSDAKRFKNLQCRTFQPLGLAAGRWTGFYVDYTDTDVGWTKPIGQCQTWDGQNAAFKSGNFHAHDGSDTSLTYPAGPAPMIRTSTYDTFVGAIEWGHQWSWCID